MGQKNVSGVILDLGGNELADEQKRDLSPEKEKNIEELIDFIEKLVEQAKGMDKILRGISISVPAVTEPKNGVVKKLLALNWEDLALRNIVQERFSLPCIVENDANIAALAEM